MNKSSFFKLLALGAVFLLAACQGVQAGSAQAPAEVQEPEVVEADQPATSNEVELEAAMVEEAAPAEEMVEEAAPAEEASTVVEEPVVEEMASEEVAAEEPALAEEEMASEEAAAEEPVSMEEEVMPEEVVDAEAVSAEEEAMSDAVVATDQGPTPEQQEILAGLTDRGVPPELHNEIWLNSDPLKLADLKGKVVIVEFWTFG